jgi:hypothetical protein
MDFWDFCAIFVCLLSTILRPFESVQNVPADLISFIEYRVMISWVINSLNEWTILDD